MILNSESAPTKSDFFQIKGHDKGAYTLLQILARKRLQEGKSASILGKMYGHLLDFKEEVKSVNFITNREFSIPYGEGDNCSNYTQVCLKGLSSKELQTLNRKLRQEFDIENIDENFPDITFLHTNLLSIKDSAGHTKGKLSEFLEAKFPGRKNSAELLYRNIFDEVKRKTKYDKVVTSLAELTKHKGIGKSYFAQMLSVLGATKDQDDIWRSVSHTLSSEGVPAGDIFQYKAMWKRLEVERMDPNNLVLKEAFRKIKQIIDSEAATLKGKKLLEISDSVGAQLISFKPILSEDLLTVIIFSELYG